MLKPISPITLLIIAIAGSACAHRPSYPPIPTTYACHLDVPSCALLDQAAAEARHWGYRTTRDYQMGLLVFEPSVDRVAFVGSVAFRLAPGALGSSPPELPILERHGRHVEVHLRPSLGGSDKLLEESFYWELLRGRVQ